MKKEKFAITGMTCAACSAGIEKTVSKLKGVEQAEVSLMGENMVVLYDDSVLTTEEIMQAVMELGYEADIFDENVLRVKTSQADVLKKRFILSIAFLLPLMYLSMGGMISLPQPTEVVGVTLQMLFALAVF